MAINNSYKNILLSIAVTLFSFSRVLLNPNETIIGRESESTSGILIWTYKMANPNLSQFPNILFDHTGFPWGENIFTFSDLTQFLPRLALIIFQSIFNPIFSYNLLIIIIFCLNFYFTQKLIGYFTRFKVVNFIFTFMLTYSNYIFTKVSEHIVYTMQFLIAISFILTIEFVRKTDLSKFYKFILLYSLSFYCDGYYPFILLPFLSVNLIHFVINYRKLTANFILNKYLYFIKTSLIIILLIPLISIFVILRDSEYAPTRSIQDFQGFSGKLDFLWKFNSLHPYALSQNLPAVFLPDAIAGSESVHSSIIQLLILVSLTLFWVGRIVKNKIFKYEFSKNRKIKIESQTLMITIAIIVFCFVYFIYFDLIILGKDLELPSEIFFKYFPYWRVSARGLVVLEFSVTILAIQLLEPLWNFENKKIGNNFLLLILLIATLFQSGFHPITVNYSITKMNNDNIFSFIKSLGIKSNGVSLSSWNDFTGYGMWIAYAGIKVPNSFFDYSNSTNFFENSMSYSDPQFLCHQKIIGSPYIAYLDVPPQSIENINIRHHERIGIFRSTRNPNNFDVLFRKNSNILIKSPNGYPSFDRSNLKILNKDFSLFVNTSNVLDIQIRNIKTRKPLKPTNFVFGISTLYNSEMIIELNNIQLLRQKTTEEVAQITIPVELGDKLKFYAIPSNGEKVNTIYVSSPHLTDCN